MNTNPQATKEKRTLLRSECQQPPREIRDNTKARRAWLAEKEAEINLRPDRFAKIVGAGSYQSISVYEVKQVEGRLRLRGICQCCGASQVATNGTQMVLHGYQRPGYGQIEGRCPGVDRAPLNIDKSFTEKLLTEAIESHRRSKAALEAAEGAKARARETARGQEEDAYLTRPQRRTVAARYRSAEEDRQHEEAMKLWAAQFPLTAAQESAEHAHEAARQREWQTRQAREHFQRLIDSKVYGTALTEEVVA